MKKSNSVIIIVFIFVALIFSCESMKSSYVQTGNSYMAIDVSSVKVVLNEPFPKYEEIGMLVVEESWDNPRPTFSEVIEKAKEICAKQGGDCLILKEKTRKTDEGEALRYDFIIGKQK